MRRVMRACRPAVSRPTTAEPALLLLHGIGDSSVSWMPVMDGLAEDHRVIAPDLLGHGESDKPRADYSAAAFANGMRDLLEVLAVERATVVGHSLGGGVAAQFAYQYPDRVERLVLVAPAASTDTCRRCCGSRPPPSASWPCRSSTRRRDGWWSASAPSAHEDGRPRPVGGCRRTATCARRIARGRRLRRLHPHAPSRRGLARPGRDHARPGLPGLDDSDDDRLGHQGRCHPRRPHAERLAQTRTPRQPVRCTRAQVTSRTMWTRSASCARSTGFVDVDRTSRVRPRAVPRLPAHRRSGRRRRREGSRRRDTVDLRQAVGGRAGA